MEPESFIGCSRMKIECKGTISAPKNQNFPSFIDIKLDRHVFQNGLLAQIMHHTDVKIIQHSVEQRVVIDKMPLPAGIFIGPVVSFAWEVYPLRMSPFVAHKVKVSSPAGCGGHQPYHLVQGQTPVNHEVARLLGHRPVHILVNEPEDDGLVSDEGLVVALGIGDGAFVRPLVGEFPPDGAHTPFLVPLLLYPFDPVVRNTHSHPEVKAHASASKRSGKSRHSADVLRNGDRIWIEFVDKDVCESEIAYGILVNSLIEIEFVVAEVGAEAVVAV